MPKVAVFDMANTQVSEIELNDSIFGVEMNAGLLHHRQILYHLRSRKWQPTPGFLPWKSHGQRSLAGYSPGGHKELDTTEHISMHPFQCNSVDAQKLDLL